MKSKLLFVLVAGGASLLVWAFVKLQAQVGGARPVLIHYVVQRADLPITVTERGDLESQDAVEILCGVADIEGDGLNGTRVKFVVPNGSSVKKDQLLIEFDRTGHIERLDRQILAKENAKSAQITAKVRYENQITQNQTAEAEASLQVRLARLAVQQFHDEEGGTFHNSLQDLELAIEEAQASRLIEKTNLDGVKRLRALNYRNAGDLASARLTALRSERALAAAISKKSELMGYEFQKTDLELSGKLASAQRSLEQVKRDNVALLAQAKAAMDAADATLIKEKERLARYEQYLEKCRVYAPQSGMVAYHVCRWHRGVREGAALQLEDQILTLPNLKRMQVKTNVHESVQDQITKGLTATVRIEALAGRTYKGTVESVSVLPDNEEEAKVYTTIVTIDDDVKDIKPGMTALCEIHVNLLEDVLSVPVQAVVQIRRDSWCYVDTGDGVERRDVKLGLTNERFIEIQAGLAEGDRVVLNPNVLMKNEAATEEAIAPDSDIPENMSLEAIEAARLAQREEAAKAAGENSKTRDAGEK